MKYLRHIVSVLVILLITTLAVGTIVEKLHGSDFARIHVYSAWCAVIGIIAVVMRVANPSNQARLERLQNISTAMLYPAVALLAAGIFIGAVWANISWGNYWSWDPKEVWALITLLVYAVPLFPNVLQSFRKPMFFHIYGILAILSVVITYFGVNLILGGVHAYN